MHECFMAKCYKKQLIKTMQITKIQSLKFMEMQRNECLKNVIGI